VARTKKIAARQGRVIVFIDESGLSERPCRARTWAPKGETPVLQYSFSWKQLSVIAGLSYWRFYFRLFNGSIKSPQIVEFLKALQATIGKKLLIIWDRLQAHRSLVTFPRLAGGSLHAPTEPPEQSPDRGVDHLHGEFRLDQLPDPRQRPQLGGKSGRQRTFFEKPHQLLALRRAEPLRTSEVRSSAQCLHATFFSCTIPAHHGLARHTDPSRDLGLAFPGREQPCTPSPAPLQFLQFL
jgi:hypothetical protein